MKNLLLAIITFLFVACAPWESPYVPDSSKYVYPFFIIDSTTTTFSDNDTITDTILQMVVIGNDVKSQFRWRLDSISWSEWVEKGTMPYLISIDSIDSGWHTLDVQTCYNPNAHVADSTFKFFRALLPSIVSMCDTIFNKAEESACTLWVNAKGSPAIKFQWHKDNIKLVSAIKDTLFFNVLGLTDSGEYTCKVINPFGNIISNKIILVISERPNNPPTFNNSTTKSIKADTLHYAGEKQSFVLVATDKDSTDKLAFSTCSLLTLNGQIAQWTPIDTGVFDLWVAVTDNRSSDTLKWKVHVLQKPDSSNQIFSFILLADENAGLTSDIVGHIFDKHISIVLPFGTSKYVFTPTITIPGTATIFPGLKESVNFIDTVHYSVTAENGNIARYTVLAIIAGDTSKSFLVFSFPKSTNPQLESSLTAVIESCSITVSVPYGTDRTDLKARFAITGSRVQIGSIVQKSDTTVNDFTNALVYSVFAVDGTKQDYTIHVNEQAPQTGKKILSFVFPAAKNNIPNDINGIIGDSIITVAFPYGSAISNLTPTITVSPAAKIFPESDSTLNFKNPVCYNVIAENDISQQYIVNVTVAKDTAKALTSFSFNNTVNPSLTTSISGIITGNSVKITLPYGTITTQLIANFGTTGETVTIMELDQVSGTTPNNFTAPVLYTIVAADSSTRVYTVTVEFAPYNFTVLFDGQGATTSAIPATMTITEPEKTIDSLPTQPKKVSYMFDGWYTGPNGTGTLFTAGTVVSKSITVYAKWSPIYSDNGWKKVDVDSSIYLYGHAACIHNNAMYISGGSTDMYSQSEKLWRSANGINWQHITDYSAKTRYGHEMFSQNDTLYITGGWNGYTGYSDIWGSGDNGFSWIETGKLPAYYNDGGLVYSRIIVTNGFLRIIGGFGTDYLFNFDYDSIYSGPKVSDLKPDGSIASRQNACLYSIGDTVWVLGGIDKNDMYLYNSSTWVKVKDSCAVAPFAAGGIAITDHNMWLFTDNAIWLTQDYGQSWEKRQNTPLWAGCTTLRVFTFKNALWIISNKGIWYYDNH